MKDNLLFISSLFVLDEDDKIKNGKSYKTDPAATIIFLLHDECNNLAELNSSIPDAKFIIVLDNVIVDEEKKEVVQDRSEGFKYHYPLGIVYRYIKNR